jgi:hypothetical protein
MKKLLALTFTLTGMMIGASAFAQSGTGKNTEPVVPPAAPAAQDTTKKDKSAPAVSSEKKEEASPAPANAPGGGSTPPEGTRMAINEQGVPSKPKPKAPAATTGEAPKKKSEK